MKFVSIAEAAKLTGKSTKTIRQWIKVGQIQGAVMEQSKHGARYMIPVEALDVEGTDVERTMNTLPEPLTQTSTVEAYIETLENRIENTLLSMETRLLEQIDARLEARDRVLLEAIRARQEETRPWWRRLISKD